MPKKAPIPTANYIKELLANKYCSPAFAFFTEVANGTGAHQRSFADGVAYSLYPSAGFEVIGFEIKVSRSDFLNELANPKKAEPVMRYCHRWWLVAPKGVVHDKEELPKDWGFMQVGGSKLFRKKQAPLLDPVDIDPAFTASLLRRATEYSIPRSIVNERISKAKEEIHKGYEGRIQRAEENLESNRNKIKQFEEASGLKITGIYHHPKEVGEAVSYVLDSKGWRGRFATSKLDTAIDKTKEAQEILKNIKNITEVIEDI